MQLTGVSSQNQSISLNSRTSDVKSLAPSIFNYLNYREYLKDFYEFKKTTAKKYSYGVFSLRAGLKSPNYLKLVMSGSRNITANNILSFATALSLNDIETVYWENLVSFNQAKTDQQRRYYLVKLAHSPLPDGGARPPIRDIKDEWDYYSSWHHAAIRELVLFEDFKEDAAYIARTLKDRISVVQAKQSIELLLRMNFLMHNAQGKLVQAERQVRYFNHDDLRNIVIQQFHRSTAELAIDSLERDKVSERDFSGLTIGISQEALPKLKAKITEFRKSLNSEFSSLDRAELVLQINFQVIPVTGRKE